MAAGRPALPSDVMVMDDSDKRRSLVMLPASGECPACGTQDYGPAPRTGCVSCGYARPVPEPDFGFSLDWADLPADRGLALA